MFCMNCGYKVEDGTQFCPNCGNPVVPQGASAGARDAAATQVIPRTASDVAATQAIQPEAGMPDAAAGTAATQVMPQAASAPNPYGTEHQPPVPPASAMPGAYGSAQGASSSPYAPTQNPAPYGAASASQNGPQAPQQPLQYGQAPQKSKGGKKGIVIAVAVVAVVIVVALAVWAIQSQQASDGTQAQSDNPTTQTDTTDSPTEPSAPQTDVSGYSLEDYLSDHPDEWAEVEDEIAAMDTDEFSLDFGVEGNEIRQVMTYQQELDDGAIEIMQTMFADESVTESMVSELRSIVGQLEQETGIDGISWFVDVRAADGSSIWNTTITS